MEWNVKNALSRDVERQHLNKILAEIRAAVSNAQTAASKPTDDVKAIVGEMVEDNSETGITVTYNVADEVLDFAVSDFIIRLTGDITGVGTVEGLHNVSISTTIDPTKIGVPEAPVDGYAYWRQGESWQMVPQSLTSFAEVEEDGFPVRDYDEESGDTTWYSREFDAVDGELVVTDGDGKLGNPTYGLADLADTGVGSSPIQLITRDAKGRVEGMENADTDDLPEGTTNLYFTDARAQAAVVVQTIDDGDITHAPSGDALFDALADKASDDNVVHKTGAENIDGPKTFLQPLTVSVAGGYGYVAVSSDVGQIGDLVWQSDEVSRWALRCTNATEEGFNTGSNLALQARSDAGSNLYTVFEVTRSTGVLNFGGPAPTIGGNAIYHAGSAGLGSGTYTPACTAINNVSSCVANPCNWCRVDDGFVLSGSVVVNPTAANTATTLDITLPIATNFTSAADCSGPVSGKAAGIPSYEVGQVFSSSGTSLLRISFYPATTNAYTMRFNVVVPIM